MKRTARQWLWWAAPPLAIVAVLVGGLVPAVLHVREQAARAN